jgi:hypothetical protein
VLCDIAIFRYESIKTLGLDIGVYMLNMEGFLRRETFCFLNLLILQFLFIDFAVQFLFIDLVL